MADPQGPETAGPSLFGSLRSFWSVLLATIYTRLDLATGRVAGPGASARSSSFSSGSPPRSRCTPRFSSRCSSFLPRSGTPAYRLWVIGGIFGVYAISGAVFAFAAYNIITNWPGFLGQTIKELRRDVEGLNQLIAKDKEVTK